MADEKKAKAAGIGEEDSFDDFEASRKSLYEPDEPHPLLFADVKATAEEPEEEPETEEESESQQDQPVATEPEPPAAPKEEKKPLARLKVDGAEIPIYDYDTAVALMQKGVHYGKRMEELSGYRKILQFIEENEDLKESLLARMRGGQPPAKQAEVQPEPEPAKFDLPAIRDDESYEDWMKRVLVEDLPKVIRSEAERIAEAKASALVKTSAQEMEERQRREKLLDACRQDPLFPQTMAVVQQAIQSKAVPPQILAMADSDPHVFAWFMTKAREQAMAIARQQQQAAAQAQKATPETVAAKPKAAPHVAAPHAESGGSRKAPPAKKSQSLEDMDSVEFRALMERVKAGRVR